MSVFLPLVDNTDAPLVDALARIAPLIVPESSIPNTNTSLASYIVLLDPKSTNLEQSIDYLDAGDSSLAASSAQIKELTGKVPPEKLILVLNAESVTAISDKLRSSVSGVLLKTTSSDTKIVDIISKFFAESPIYVLPSVPPRLSLIRDMRDAKATLVIPTSLLTLGSASSDQLNVADAYTSLLSSDRADGLIPTIVSSHTQSGRSLGMVYSSKESIQESIISGKGVYQSRKHGLWRKGETSGSTQDVVKITADCDFDTLEFSVIQHGTGFCHLGTATCFGQLSGLAALESTLKSRLSNAPEGSYTRRLFDDRDLLDSKIREEADELCRAEDREDIANEAADVIYFALTKCIANGVGIADIERSLDKRAKKVTRRPGNAKPQFQVTRPLSELVPSPGGPQATSTPRDKSPGPPSASQSLEEDDDSPIKMQTHTLSSLSPSARSALLKRPVLNSSQMIEKVRPIVDAVRTSGDSALLELTKKFDKATLSSPVLLPPFKEEDMELPDEVKEAIDIAYDNIYKFHSAQLSQKPLVVETMPGVVCSRFSRPIDRVGLYVPGGTAILPSTALMLGVPAQVAQCPTIILATPPRPDGSVSPEVLYVAHRVGASAILLAGGGQAVAALAYGTESVQKVDKIFGPGNQWVTAAKMLVQNDTDAAVGIDMPAGPSEVLVIADQTANPAFVAADLLSQAEHGIDSQVVLLAINLPQQLLSEIESEVDRQAHSLARVEIMRESVRKSLIVLVESVEEALEFSNDYAPEHLILHLEDAPRWVDKVRNAGSVFVGEWSPESCGDYASGTNHTLPTNGYARQYSGVNTLSFQKHITSQELTKEGLERLGPVVATLADCEGLGAHANAVRVRLGVGV